MKKIIFLTSVIILGIMGCKVSNKEETNQFIQKDFINYIKDNEKLIIESNRNLQSDPASKEIIFNNTFIKVKTAQSLLEDEYENWLIGLEKSDFHYTDLNTLCLMINYMYEYTVKADDNYKKNITEYTLKNVGYLYDNKSDIIKLRDRNNEGESLQSFVHLCQ